MSIHEINKDFGNGIIPFMLNFNSNQTVNCQIDFQKLKFNSCHKEPHYYEKRFPKGFENMIGFDKIIQSFIDKNADLSPYEEMEKMKIIELKVLTELVKESIETEF
jgi:hypothetical protein